MARKPAVRSVGSHARGGITRATAVYEKLRADIADGLLAPGSKLRVELMCDKYGVGATPLREALSRLSAEGLVVRNDLRGFSVAPLNWAELPILTETRIRLETLALKDAISARTSDWEDRLVLLHHRLGRTPRSLNEQSHQPNPEWEALHRDFHRALLATCPSRWLLSYCDKLAEEAYRLRQLAASGPSKKRNEHAEHQSIMNAAIQGDIELAIRLLSAHYQKTEELVSKAASGSAEKKLRKSRKLS